MDPFRDRVAVITGGASGIGAGLARAFAARGAKLVLADLDTEGLARIAADLEAGGTPVLTLRTDVGERAEVEALAAAAFARFGAVHLLCNNAGVGVFGPIAGATHNDWLYTMRVDFWGVVHGIEAFVPRLVAQGQPAHIVNTASMAGLVGMQWLGVYSAAKFAVVGLSEALWRELAPHGIAVSVLCPMVVDTNLDATSARWRPPALRDAPASAATGAAPPAMAGGVVTVAEVAARVVRGIERRDFYLFTHPDQRDILRKRAARQDAMFEPGRW
ncbi:MAG: SDR family NAD(P)-dependent oxidoreductase [Candidatus Binatia bacterium]